MDESAPNKGFRYLYLSPSDYMKVGVVRVWSKQGVQIFVSLAVPVII